MIAESLGSIIFWISGFAYLALSILLVRGWDREGPGAWLIVAAAITAGWAVTSALFYAFPNQIPPALPPAADALRSLVWIAVLGRLLLRSRELTGGGRPALLFGLISAVGVLGILLVINYLAPLAAALPEIFTLRVPVAGSFLAHLVLAVAGLLLVENLYRNSSPSSRWGLQLFCIGVGAGFAYDVVLYSDALLFQTFQDDLLIARGAISALIVPLIAVSAARNPAWKLDVFVSRRMVFHTISLTGTGAYLILMAAAGYYFREVGGEWGTLIQITFLFGAALALLVVLSSGRIRGQLRVFLNKHFFNYNYDYREEWLNVLATISSLEHNMPLQVRVIKAVCDIVDSPGGLLWCVSEGKDTYRPVERWNFPRGTDGVEPDESPFVSLMKDRAWVVSFDEVRSAANGEIAIDPPRWAKEDERYWLAVPLVHHGDLTGFIVLERPRTERDLNWEDYDILRTVGRQAASYLAEEGSVSKLAEARQFSTFNRRFAFVMHDLKNLVSQLSLVTRNAEQHKDNPEFQSDMLVTVQDSVRKMTILLERMSEQSDRGVRAEDFELNDLLARIVEGLEDAGDKIDLTPVQGGLWIVGEKDRIEVMFRHLIQNGLEATGDNGSVSVKTDKQGDMAVAVIGDDGCGMDEDFVRNALFKPFHSTKAKGYGIGAFESRQIVSEHSGRLDVSSTPGSGTVFQVRLPLSKRSMVQSGDIPGAEEA